MVVRLREWTWITVERSIPRAFVIARRFLDALDIGK
jgi:hypothetical protein